MSEDYRVWPRDRERGFYDWLEALGWDCRGGSVIDTQDYTLRPYWWGDCTCGAEDYGGSCKETCAQALPNFVYKPTGLKVWWYKYPFRGANSNQVLDEPKWNKILDALSRTPSS